MPTRASSGDEFLGRKSHTGTMPEPAEERAAQLHEELVSLLKLLNRADEEEEGARGYELGELHRFLVRGNWPGLSAEAVEQALGILIRNGLAAERSDREYAWERGRVVGSRYEITTEGKEFLLRELDRTGRIG